MALGVDLQLLPAGDADLILAAAIISILANPFFPGAGPLPRAPCAAAARKGGPCCRCARPGAHPASRPVPALPETALANHTVLVGYGRVGRLVADGLKAAGTPFLVVEDRAAGCWRS